FIFTVGKRGRGLIHRLCQIARRQVPDKLPRLDNVTHAVFPAITGKTDNRRTVVEAVKEAIRREIQLTGLIARSDPADRTWANNGIQRVMRQAVPLRWLIKVHVALSLVGQIRMTLRSSPWFRTISVTQSVRNQERIKKDNADWRRITFLAKNSYDL